MRESCPCGSGHFLAACCGRHHDGEPAATPEALMRARFSAFALGRNDYLLATWHPDTRPASLPDEDPTHWIRLEIIESSSDGDQGRVHFRATFREGRRWGVLEEDSRFTRLDAGWCYADGEPRVMRLKPGRNNPCPCGSGRKGKQCCLRS
ncbi:YchJ family protein [Halomonas sp. 18H]|uniref:YchJ family protein n=1 Tax=Halomonas almeriensis TaxID=308163 RepID=UPI00222F5946|nr:MULTISPECIES: YchJ family protein [Halomonas]MCW4151779.1 YchJ family protein [Halomonas sp. 18H]MDN3554025.1 YchJ family protein [Halomonas almeriensis]